MSKVQLSRTPLFQALAVKLALFGVSAETGTAKSAGLPASLCSHRAAAAGMDFLHNHPAFAQPSPSPWSKAPPGPSNPALCLPAATAHLREGWSSLSNLPGAGASSFPLFLLVAFPEMSSQPVPGQPGAPAHHEDTWIVSHGSAVACEHPLWPPLGCFVRAACSPRGELTKLWHFGGLEVDGGCLESLWGAGSEQ